MPITAAQIQADITASLAPADPNGLVNGDIALYWSIYADKAALGPRLQELYTLRRCIDLLLRFYATQADVTVGEDVAVKQSQISDQLEAQRQRCEEEIRHIETEVANVRPLLVGALTTVAPVSQPLPLPAALPPDGNDQVYAGTPYQTVRWPQR